MHPSAKRLYEAARNATPPVVGKSAVARWLNESPQTVNNWENPNRGVSKAGALAAQKLSGYSATWILTGTGAMKVGEPEAANVFDAPTKEELELLDNFRHMLDHDREELAAEIALRAARAKDDIDRYLKRMGLTPRPASASARAAAKKSKATTKPAQEQLPLEDHHKR